MSGHNSDTLTEETMMGGYKHTRLWLTENKNRIIVSVGLVSQTALEEARLDILINLVWPEALVCPDQQEVIIKMIRSTLLPARLTVAEVYQEARAIATYLNSMT